MQLGTKGRYAVMAMIVHGDRDDIVPSDSVRLLIEKLSKQRGITITYQLVEEAGHFFKEHMLELNQHILSYLDGAILREQEPLKFIEKKGSSAFQEDAAYDTLDDFDDFENDDDEMSEIHYATGE